MAKLIACTAGAATFPFASEGVEIVEVPFAPMTSIAAHKGRERDAAKVLDSLGLGLPKPGEVLQHDEARVMWFGIDHAMLIGVEAPDALGAVAALCDQSDAWCRVTLSGPAVRQVLTHLTPVDLRDGAFPVGRIARTDIQHMSGALARLAPDQWEIMVFRSMADTLAHDLKTALV